MLSAPRRSSCRTRVWRRADIAIQHCRLHTCAEFHCLTFLPTKLLLIGVKQCGNTRPATRLAIDLQFCLRAPSCTPSCRPPLDAFNTSLYHLSPRTTSNQCFRLVGTGQRYLRRVHSKYVSISWMLKEECRDQVKNSPTSSLLLQAYFTKVELQSFRKTRITLIIKATRQEMRRAVTTPLRLL